MVTAFSGVTQWRHPDGADPVDYQIINQQGVTLQVFALSQMFGVDDARQIPVERGFAASAAQIGQVFGVTLDDGLDAAGKPGAPNLYATATSAFGLQLLLETDTEVTRTKTGGVGVRFMQGQFGAEDGAGPGTIWKVDGATGVISMFANVTLNGVENSGPALGNITFDPISRRLFVSDLQTGMIHGFGLDGREVDQFDHGVLARTATRLVPVAHDPARRIALTDPGFLANEPATWGFALPERQVWGLAVRDRRLFYSVSAGPEIWSVGLALDGTIQKDARVEIRVVAPVADPVTDITFDADGSMFLAQRGAEAAAYDYTSLATPERASVLVYTGKKRPDGTYEWAADAGEYPVGFQGENRNTNGGVALGYGYYPDGFIKYDSCEAMVWSTGEMLRESAEHAARLGDPGVVHGLQGTDKTLIKPANVPPFKSYHIDYDELYTDDMFHGHMGDVAIWAKCGNAIGATSTGGSSETPIDVAGKPIKPTVPVGWTPRVPGQPDIKISKTCSPAAFGGALQCTVTLINVGDVEPAARVGFTDLATPDFGVAGGGFPLVLLDAGLSDPNWVCSPLPATSLTCSIAGAALTPGKAQSVNVVVDISAIASQPGWQLTNSATLSTNGTKATATVGDTLVLSKTAPATCRADEVCTFTISMTNFGLSTFSGTLAFSDDLNIDGQLASGVVVDGVFPSQGCSIPSGGNLPLEWECPITIPSFGIKTFEVDMFIPKLSGPAAGSVPARNCVVATSPFLAPASNIGSGQGTSPVLSNMLTAPNPAAAPGMVCVDFQIEAANPVLAPPPLVGLPKSPFPMPPGLGCKGRPEIVISSVNPGTFSSAGVPIDFEYTVTNKTSCDIFMFRVFESLPMTGPILCDSSVSPQPSPFVGTWLGMLPVNRSVVCRNTHVTVSGTGSISNQVRLDSRW
ncbi:hypothetical protein [Anianabacter salinae]|uniref:hypothetical protein n=1 Tax=Anianabacter salinae TaxID=2851023 RepID=UPI00225DE1F2|nr:hypothetical protein [Anianabacter salinae]MBV0913819.1 hypothetical protein [Anianabacter salinae]